MCCFSGTVERVSDTRIFARGMGARQLLVYAMKYAAASDLAMVLPLPVVPGAGEDGLRFIDLSRCPKFFDELAQGFRDEDTITLSADVSTRARTLAVHNVGSYEASFVPSPEDFGRLDERFRLPAHIWVDLSHYRDWGFAVFKLKPTALADVHPMAFEFARRDTSRLFFPTLHVHRGRFDASAGFDHELFCQAEPSLNFHLHEWHDSPEPASAFVTCPEAARLLDLQSPCWRVFLRGRLENRDTWVGPGSRLPSPRG